MFWLPTDSKCLLLSILQGGASAFGEVDRDKSQRRDDREAGGSDAALRGESNDGIGGSGGSGGGGRGAQRGLRGKAWQKLLATSCYAVEVKNQGLRTRITERGLKNEG